jgi:hypothetical protein
VRTKTVFILLLTFVSSSNVTGQQHALPTVTARTVSTDASALPPATTERNEPIVYLDAMPIRDDQGQITITEAARENDYASFDALYTTAKARGERVSQYDALHELWSWSMNSPIGAFYGPDLYERFAAAYPGFADYIADYKIVDSRGNVFYPTAETRRFLLDQAIRGTNGPRIAIARTEPRAESFEQSQSVTRDETGAVREIAPYATTPSVPRATTRPRSRLQKSDATPANKPSFTPAVKPAPVQVAAAVGPVAAPPIAVPAAPAAAPVQQPAKPVLASMVSPAPSVPVVKPATQAAIGRGLLLLLIGLVGLGVLAAILRAPKEDPLTLATALDGKPTDNVEPIRKADAVTPPQQQPAGKKSSATRANGSR